MWSSRSPAARLIFLYLINKALMIFGQESCSDAPTPALQTVCEQLNKWDKSARAATTFTGKLPLPPAIPGLPTPLIAAEIAPVAATPYQCMDLGCLCSYMGGNGQQGSNACTLANGQQLKKALRKEYRTLSDEERGRYHAAIKSIKNSGEYDRIATIHAQFATAGSAHSGPGFLPWHREFMKRVEIALRQVDPGLAIPYWDSTMDGALPNARHSIMWLPEFMGDTDRRGNLVTGEFANWRTLAGRPNILRSVGAQGKLFSEEEVQSVVRQTSINRVLAFTVPQQGCSERINWNDIEYTHGNIHIFVGGDMQDQSTAANDPIFFLHHSFVDMMWELWRQRNQRRSERETVYPTDDQRCASVQHFQAALMRPFEPWQNIDGLSNKYTDNLYEYAPRPTCDLGPSCGSRYLFCDRSSGRARCVAKVRPGGICTGFTSDEVCYNGVCEGERCSESTAAPLPGIPEQTPSPSNFQPIASSLPRQQPRSSPVDRSSEAVVACYNEHECCAIWAEVGECNENPLYMKVWCKVACDQCHPIYDSSLDCVNRHRNCEFWAKAGECKNNQNWMFENCRQSCGHCGMTRQQVCRAGAITVGPTPKKVALQTPPVPVLPPLSPVAVSPSSFVGGGDNAGSNGDVCTSDGGCFNEHICCKIWSELEHCTLNPFWMHCNCKVSCGQCAPQKYIPGKCTDYHPQCLEWATSGECRRNLWMLENCRKSCGTCFTDRELRKICTAKKKTRAIGDMKTNLSTARRRIQQSFRKRQLLTRGESIA